MKKKVMKGMNVFSVLSCEPSSVRLISWMQNYGQSSAIMKMPCTMAVRDLALTRSCGSTSTWLSLHIRCKHTTDFLLNGLSSTQKVAKKKKIKGRRQNPIQVSLKYSEKKFPQQIQRMSPTKVSQMCATCDAMSIKVQYQSLQLQQNRRLILNSYHGRLFAQSCSAISRYSHLLHLPQHRHLQILFFLSAVSYF